jgi:nickel-dependent lactate racemase
MNLAEKGWQILKTAALSPTDVIGGYPFDNPIIAANPAALTAWLTRRTTGSQIHLAQISKRQY